MTSKHTPPILIRLIVLTGLALASLSPSCSAADTSTAPSASKTNAPATKESSLATLDLFDGESLRGWKITDFAGHGDVRVESMKKVVESLSDRAAENLKKNNTESEAKGSVVVMEMGAILTGIQYTNEVPVMNYEVSLEAMRLDGNDFFCGLTFPVNDTHCSLIVGGWGGGVVGISSIDGFDASENETTKFKGFESGRWYPIRVRITPAKLEAWLEKEKVVEVKTTGRRLTLRAGEIELSKPFGLAAYQTAVAYRNIRLERLSDP
ncbi:MAG TPA: DUF1080 domain-containing protein [Verrucomicrobiota bacterium]|nr:DUF1080 domain-containing protein [Verrucomicrobiota bacterium]